MSKHFYTMDGNEAVAYVAYRVSEVIAIYPITPSSPMGEWADAWAAENQPNIWGTVPSVVELQSEGGAAGTVHGALQTGALTTTFTASQGLLLMIPNMYKIAGELTPTVFHIAARSLAAQGLSIFGDHSDVMSVRQTGYAMLCSCSVQESMDMALISHAATLETRIPFLHFFDGFRTSHEVAKIEVLPDEIIQAMIDDKLVAAHRGRSLSPDHPVLRGTAQNPDVYFQARESVNRYYTVTPDVVQKTMDQFAKLAGRQYQLFEYHGHPQAERVIVMMGSGAEAAHEAVDYMTAKGEKVGLLKVRLYRPFDIKRFVSALPETVKAITILDRTKEPGSLGEPLYLDCLAAMQEGAQNGWCRFKTQPKMTGGRYGLSSKEFTPAMVKAVFDELKKDNPKNHYTIGIEDDVTHTSLAYDPAFSTEDEKVVRSVFYGLGSDGTVGANKNSIKIIGENTDNYAQGYFVYDSKKAGAVTVSHLRFGPKYIRSTYLVTRANFVGCHQPVFLERYDQMLDGLMPGGTFLLNTAYGKDQIWDQLPRLFQKQIIDKKIKFYVIDAYKVAKDSGMKQRINTVMQVCFFAISGVLPKEEAIEAIKKSIIKTYGNKGEEIVNMNLQAVDHTLAHLHEVKVPSEVRGTLELKKPMPDEAPDFVKNVLGKINSGHGDELPVSALPDDGTYPTGTCMWEKRNIALEIPVWDPNVCIQCGKCAIVCPHASIRLKAYSPSVLEKAPSAFQSTDARDPQWKGMKFTIQVAPEDCTGCGVCVDICPAKNKAEVKLKAINMRPQQPLREQERHNWEFFLKIPDMDRRTIKVDSIRQQQVQLPLFEFSSACAGCGETPYLKLVSQLFGDRMIVANATGCSSIYGGNLPLTPWSKNADGRGPAWCNSLFEDNAEFGLGYRVSIDKQKEFAEELLKKLSVNLGEQLVQDILQAPQKTEADIYDQRQRVAVLKEKLKGQKSPEALQLSGIADLLVKKSVWIIGGDGWAYDIGYGGLDHVLASGRNVNILVLDTEVYSNTGGQASKSTPRGAVAKFAAGGKQSGKKDLGLMAMTYGNVYVARIAMGARDEHSLKAILEAEAHEGPSLIIAYSHCVAHGINMTTAMQNQKAAVECGQWMLYRFNPARLAEGQNPLQLDSKAPKKAVEEYLMMENRFKMLTKSRPQEAKALFKLAQQDAEMRWKLYDFLANGLSFGPKSEAKPTLSTSNVGGV
jgi:pyruvate-ferredoxin/flavodoxin oxidoreductase